MKTLLKLGNITVGNVSVSDITIEQEYTAKDVVELAFNGKRFVKELIKELPEVMEDLYTAAVKFNELDKKAEEEINWTITSVSHSVVKQEEIEKDYQFAKLREEVYNFVRNNGNGNEDVLIDKLWRHRNDLTTQYIHDEISYDEYNKKCMLVDQLRDVVLDSICAG